MPLVWGFGYLELCLYGIRELAGIISDLKWTSLLSGLSAFAHLARLWRARGSGLREQQPHRGGLGDDRQGPALSLVHIFTPSRYCALIG